MIDYITDRGGNWTIRESSDKIAHSATVKISDTTYDLPIQRLYEVEGWDQSQSANELLHFFNSAHPLKILTMYLSQIADIPTKQANTLVDSIPSNSDEIVTNPLLSEEAA